MIYHLLKIMFSKGWGSLCVGLLFSMVSVHAQEVGTELELSEYVLPASLSYDVSDYEEHTSWVVGDQSALLGSWEALSDYEDNTSWVLPSFLDPVTSTEEVVVEEPVVVPPSQTILGTSGGSSDKVPGDLLVYRGSRRPSVSSEKVVMEPKPSAPILSEPVLVVTPPVINPLPKIIPREVASAPKIQKIQKQKSKPVVRSVPRLSKKSSSSSDVQETILSIRNMLNQLEDRVEADQRDRKEGLLKLKTLSLASSAPHDSRSLETYLTSWENLDLEIAHYQKKQKQVQVLSALFGFLMVVFFMVGFYFTLSEEEFFVDFYDRRVRPLFFSS